MLAAFLALLLATPAAADPLPPAGFYCPIGRDIMPIIVDVDGTVGIDSLECRGARLSGGRLTSRTCYASGSSVSSVDVELIPLPGGGGLLHDGVRYRRQVGRCP